MQLAVARLVALTPDRMQRLEQRQQLVEEFQARDVFVTDIFTLLSSHAPEYARYWSIAQAQLYCASYPNVLAQILCRTGLGEMPHFCRRPGCARRRRLAVGLICRA